MNNMNIWCILNQLPLTQLVKSPTRGLKILDIFITNVPNYWKSSKVAIGLVRSDQDMVITHLHDKVKAKRKNSYFRDVRKHHILNMLHELKSIDCNMISTDGQV